MVEYRKARRWLYLATGLPLVALTGCAHHYVGVPASDPYGFFSGIWHGFVFPYALTANIISWALSLAGVSFLADVEIVGRPNTGLFFYYVGFACGLSAYGGGSARSGTNSQR
jgi:hypothetical protein